MTCQKNDPELKYKEKSVEDGKVIDIDISMKYICPTSSGTIKKQKQISDIPSLTIVAFIENERHLFKEAFDYLLDFRNFQSAPLLHTTLLGITELNLISDSIRKLLIKAVEDYFSQNAKKIQVNFKQIRPGTCYYPGSQLPIKGLSDGTVFAGTFCDSKSETFNELCKGLANALKNKSKLEGLIPVNLERKFPTVWCTLGYFDTLDFKLSKHMYHLFEGLRDFKKSVEIRRLSLVRYKRRSLIDAEEMWGINL